MASRWPGLQQKAGHAEDEAGTSIYIVGALFWADYRRDNFKYMGASY